MGREHKPTDKKKEHVKVMAEVGVSEDMIAKYIGVTKKTLRKHYAEILGSARALGVFQVAGALKALALAGNPAACIFYLKIQDKWLEITKDDIKEDGERVTKVQIEVIQPKGD